MSDLLKLAERCEAATGPDRELDCAISLALVVPPEGCRAVASSLSAQAGLIVDQVGRLHGTVDYQPFTASLDAAMTLVPKGWRVSTEDASFQKAAWLHPENGQNGGCVCSSYDRAKTVVLALCAAALRARAAQ